MSETVLFVLTFIAILGCGVVGGAFFAFSGFVMKSLSHLRPEQGIAAMQSMNVYAVTPPLMIALFGTGLICLMLAAGSLLSWQTPGALSRLAGSLFYLVGTVGVTMVFNVPRNNALAAVDPASEAGAAEWDRYVPGWTAWNSVRTVAAIAAAALLILSLLTER